MPFLIVTANDPSRSEDRERVRPAHLGYLDQKMQMLLAAGATLSDDGKTPTGSCYLLDVDERSAAEAFMAEEPYHRAGLLTSVTYSRWRKAIFDFRRQLPP